ncbi:RNase adapter RapZ [Tissierella praeacuta]|uniref:RNase adapter RapZ n=1 Tax=Tissierella praeacuta TaxID=43131 RepID=UPI000EBF9187|nr:RNase adapter RapZ [Tissierella praeacuta]MBU5255140.1 RNase adapter RapZ [Tissierella praeacuta]HAE92018.1 RNase adapter RapZ [Tissierella sp.]
MEFLIITGMSGAGKSQAMKVMEDIDYYCMDNLPPALLTKFAELCSESKRAINKVAVVVDIRSGEFFDDLFKGLQELNDSGIKYRILFLDAANNVLIKRYKELRRPHPLNPEGSIIEGIKEERELLENVKKRADYIIDTSNSTLGMLKEEMSKIFLEGKKSRNISLSIISFGFKHGTLLDGDLIFDVRFIPNPFYISELREFTGEDKNVRDYVFKWPETNIFISKVIDMLEFLIPHYTREGKTQLIIGIGCTGGVHRSVAIANEISKTLEINGHRVAVSHRDYRLK